MNKISILFISILLVVSLSAQPTKWGFDPAHSKVKFSVAHMMISEVDGQFNKYDGTVSAEQKNFSDAQISFTIDVNSIDTDNADRDKHLKSPDFFNTDEHPSISFKSTGMKPDGEGKYKLTGDFTMLGVTKPITLDVKFGGTIKDPYGNTKAGFKITGTINRNDWGLKYNSVMDTGGLMIGEEVDIVCNIELIRQ